MGRRHSIALLALLALLGVAALAAVAASAAGWLGEDVVCGADRSLGCATWPMPISALVWSAFIAALIALLTWHVRT